MSWFTQDIHVLSFYNVNFIFQYLIICLNILNLFFFIYIHFIYTFSYPKMVTRCIGPLESFDNFPVIIFSYLLFHGYNMSKTIFLFYNQSLFINTPFYVQYIFLVLHIYLLFFKFKVYFSSLGGSLQMHI